MAQYLTAPVPSKKMPGGIPFIIVNEAAERFSFYGMRSILVIFMTHYLMGSDSKLAVMSESEAKSIYHLFVMSVYFTPILGAFISDLYFGKYKTIMSLSFVYCMGHLALALDETRFGLYMGLGLIALGSGGIKACVSAHVGDQFGRTNQHLLQRVFSIFYFAINLGSFFSTLITPWLLDRYHPSVAFGVPGVLMALATLAFWMGRNKFVHIPPSPNIAKTFDAEGLAVVGRLGILYVFVAVFWSLFDQTGSSWVLQAQKMDRIIPWFWANGEGKYELELLSSQIQAANPIMVMIMIPIFAYIIYPAINSVMKLTELRKIGLGMFLAITSFALLAIVEHKITAGQTPHITWQLAAYVLLTGAEVMVSITCLEFSYTQATKRMKSFIMSFYLLSVALGNFIAAATNGLITAAEENEWAIQTWFEGPNYFWFFTGLMLAAAIAYVPVAMKFKVKYIVQDEQPVDNIEAAEGVIDEIR